MAPCMPHSFVSFPCRLQLLSRVSPWPSNAFEKCLKKSTSTCLPHAFALSVVTYICVSEVMSSLSSRLSKLFTTAPLHLVLATTLLEFRHGHVQFPEISVDQLNWSILVDFLAEPIEFQYCTSRSWPLQSGCRIVRVRCQETNQRPAVTVRP